MKKNRIFYKLVLLMLNILFTCIVWAQPYKYDMRIVFPPEGHNAYESIYRFNLQTGETDTISSCVGGWGNFFLNPSQTRLFIELEHTNGEYKVLDPEMPDSTLKVFHTYGGTINGALDGRNNTMYVAGWFGYSETDTAVGLGGSYIVDRNTLAILDSTLDSEINLKQDLSIDGFRNNLSSFLSSDKSKFYTFVYNDKTGIYFDVASTNTNRHTGRKQCGTLGGFIYGPSVEDRRNGYAIISYETSAGFAYQRYVICDVDSGVIRAIIPFTQRADVFLSADAKYTLIEEANWDPSAATRKYLPGEYIPGNIYVYESKNGKLVQHLTLPPQGEVLIFDNYPNMLYYYLPNENRSINIDLSKLTPPSGCNVKLINSAGTKLTGGALQYYEGSWKDAVNNNDGTFSVTTSLKTISLRMTYEYGTQIKSNVTVGQDTIAFQTVNAQIQLQNSSGVLFDTGSVQYYAGAWRNLGTTINGIAAKELLPANYSFRMTYVYASKDKQQDISTNATVVFQTVNAAVQLQNSQGALMPAPLGDQGTVQYYSGAWRDLGTTTNGIANKELLPNNYSFRMTYAYASKDKQQDISTNSIVVFQTVNAAVQLQNSQGNFIDQGTVQYYSGAWRDLGITTNGIANKELLPNNYSFRMNYAYASKDKQQDIGINATVVFQTVNAAVQLQNSQGVLMPAPLGDQGTVQYYSGAWRSLGTTTNGTASKELLPNNYSFRMTYEYVSVDKSQDLSANSTVSFSTVLCTVRVSNLLGQVVNDAQVSYYSGAWRQIGNTVNGAVTKELLPVNLSFRVKYGTQQQDKQQNLSMNNVVEFGIQ